MSFSQNGLSSVLPGQRGAPYPGTRYVEVPDGVEALGALSERFPHKKRPLIRGRSSQFIEHMSTSQSTQLGSQTFCSEGDLRHRFAGAYEEGEPIIALNFAPPCARRLR